MDELANFLKIVPRLPGSEKQYTTGEPIKIDPAWSREEVIEYLESIRETNITADLAFYAYRDMTRCDWRPFIKAAVERCPVSIGQYTNESIEQVCAKLSAMPNESIYEGPRLAQPDEVVNYNTGDDIEKAFTMANVIRSRNLQLPIQMNINPKQVLVNADNKYVFATSKGLQRQIHLGPDSIRVDG